MKVLSTVLVFMISFLPCHAQQELADRSYFPGRDYFVLRSGQAKMVIQSDKTNIGPAFTYLLFDAKQIHQTSDKKQAFNYKTPEGFAGSALEVIMRGYSFTAQGNNTLTRWTLHGGIPSVQATWWASGVKVREIITPLYSGNTFRRRIILESADLVHRDTVSLRLSLPGPGRYLRNNIIVFDNNDASVRLSVDENLPVKASSLHESLEVGPLVLGVGERDTIDSYLFLGLFPKSKSKPDIGGMIAGDIDGEDIQLTRENFEKTTNSIVTNDELVQGLFDNCRFILPGFVSAGGRMDAGIFEYGNQWVRDASQTALGMISIGRFEIARAMLHHMLEDLITAEGTTMIGGGFDQPDREQFDQMGEFMHAMKTYVDWTGDTSLLSGYRNKIIAMIERPLNPVFMDSTGMVHNTREFWERTFTDAYELAYQVWVIRGLRDAAGLAGYLNAGSDASRWLRIADRMQNAMLTHPSMKLVNDGHLIKRRNVTGEIADTVKQDWGYPSAPVKVEYIGRLMPDATLALPIFLDVVPPESALAKNTLAELQKLWNRRWSFGGYDRYNTSSQGDQPGPWTFATAFIMRAQHAAGELSNSRRSLEWLRGIDGGGTGAWFEEIPVTANFRSGILPWTTSEVVSFLTNDLLGIKFVNNKLSVRPNFFKEMTTFESRIRYRKGWINLKVSGSGKVDYAIINGVKVQPDSRGAIVISKGSDERNVTIYLTE